MCKYFFTIFLKFGNNCQNKLYLFKYKTFKIIKNAVAFNIQFQSIKYYANNCFARLMLIINYITAH